jgi:hypothetical protein
LFRRFDAVTRLRDRAQHAGLVGRVVHRPGVAVDQPKVWARDAAPARRDACPDQAVDPFAARSVC